MSDAADRRAFTLIQISDPHLSARRPFFQHNFAVLVDAIAAEQADLVICTGDMTIDGAAHREELGFARRAFAAIDREILFLPGNHDIGNSLPDVRGGEVTIDAARLAAYRAAFGVDHWMRDAGHLRFVGLDTMLPGSGLPEEAEQEAMLGEAIASRGRRRLVVLGHKPLYMSRPDEPEQTQSALFTEHRMRWAAMLSAAGPMTYLSGHIHEMKTARWGNIRQVWAPSTAFVMDVANRFLRRDRPKRKPGIKRTGYLRHRFSTRGHTVDFVEPPGLLITDLGNWFFDPRGFHARYGDEPWRGLLQDAEPS